MDPVAGTDKTSETNCHLLKDVEGIPDSNYTQPSDDTINLKVDIEVETKKPLIFRVNEVPPLHLTFIFALQQSLLAIASPLTITILISEVICIQKDEHFKLQILSSIMFIVGLSTFVMSTFGVRLPVFQGPGSTYLLPLLAMTAMDDWRCPATFEEFDPMTNSTILMTTLDNTTTIPARELSLSKISLLSGSLMAAGTVHFLIGATGLVGILCRYIGPITIVPTIVIIGLHIYKFVVKFFEPNIGIGMITFCLNLLFSLVLGNKLTPLPWWNRQKGFHIVWYPLHQVFSILISILISWGLSFILTNTGVLTDDPNDKGYLARTDARSFIIEKSEWFLVPYPGQFGSFNFSVGVFINFLIATMLSVLDSIGDYAACARIARVSPPPPYAFNRGIAAEGLLSLLGSTLGCCCATVSYGNNIGAMGITRVVSRRVFQVVGLFFIMFSMIGKIGAFFITIPYPVLGGTTLITMGIFVGVVLSYLKAVDLSSTRNLAIIGIALLTGLVIPDWVYKNSDVIKTGNKSFDLITHMLLSNSSFICGLFSCTMDNLVPGTLRERGLLDQLNDLDDEEAKELALSYEDGPEVYRLPFIPQRFRRSKLAKLIPLFEFEDTDSLTSKNN